MIDNNVYEWLNNNNNVQLSNTNNRGSTNTTSLIECILIISINGILIERQSLFDYCNSVVALNDKRMKSTEERDEHEAISSYYHGLSKQQFQIIYNNINSIKNNKNNTATTTITLPPPTTLNNSNYNSTEYISTSRSSNKIKFNSSITIISENNKTILNHHHNDNNNNNITTTTTTSSNNGYIRNGSRDINIIFFLVWRNTVIRNEILFHTRLYSLHMDRWIELSFDELSTYKYKSYLDIIGIVINARGYGFDEYIIKPNLIPYGVSGITFKNNTTLKVNSYSIPDSVTSVAFNCRIDPNQIFTKDILPDSITNLKFDYGMNSNQPLSTSWLPSSLKSLTLGESYQLDIEPNQLPESLTELKLHKDNKTFGNGPISTKPFHFKFDSNGNKIKLTNESIPVSATNLEFDPAFNQPIKPGDIPHNVSSVELSEQFDNEIQVGSLPLSLKSLGIRYMFDRPISANVLPSNLTYIEMFSFDQTLIPNLFPQSISTIKLYSFNKPIPVGYFYNYINLKSLELCHFTKDIPEKTLPESLTSLKLGNHYDLLLNVNALPSSLSTLTITDINNSQLPSSITSLSTYTKNPIPAGILPCNLKVLYIISGEFNQHLSFESFEQGILPRSLQSIYINDYNTNLINSLDSHFFKKYIRFE